MEEIREGKEDSRSSEGVRDKGKEGEIRKEWKKDEREVEKDKEGIDSRREE